MKILNIVLSIVLACSIGLCFVPYTTQTPSLTPDLTNIFCNYVDPICPFFDPCGEESHIDMVCADLCCKTYKSSVIHAHDLACLLYNTILLDYIHDLEEISDDFTDCLNNGVSPDICAALRASSIQLLNDELAESKLAISHILEAKLDRALNAYYDCLLACDCILNPPMPE